MSREPLYEQVSEGQAERGRKGKSWPCVQRKSLWSDWHLIEIKLLRYLEVGWIRIPACCSVCPPSPLFCYLSFFPLFYSLLFNSGYSPFAPVRTRVFLSLSLSFSPPSLALLLSLAKFTSAFYFFSQVIPPPAAVCSAVKPVKTTPHL